MITFLLGGLWHGANWRFVMWGALHGFYLVVERVLVRWFPPVERLPRIWRWVVRAVAWVIVFHGVCLSWVFFRAETFEDAGLILRQLADWEAPATLLSPQILVVLVVSYLVQFMDGEGARRVMDWYNRRGAVVQGALAALVLTLILGMGPRGVAPFIYFQF